MRSLAVAVPFALALTGLLARAVPAVEPVPTPEAPVARRMTPEELQRRLRMGAKPIILDTRASTGDVMAKGAIHVTGDRIAEWAKGVPKTALIVAYCT
jgi:hypothetical protein